MKVHLWLVVLGVCGAVCLSGCQRSVKADAAAKGGHACSQKVVHAEETAVSDTVKGQTRTVTVRHPETGEIVYKNVPVDPGCGDQSKTRVVRTRDPETGQTNTMVVPIETKTTSRSSAAPRTRTVRTRDPKTGRTISKQVPVNTAEAAFEARWEQSCGVQQAFHATNRILYETLGLQKFSKGGGYYIEPESDYISATLKARSTIDIVFDVSIVLISPESSMIIIKGTSKDQPTDVVKKHVLYIQARIGEAIAQEPETAAKAAAYPKMMFFDDSVPTIYSALYKWAKTAGFDIEGSNRVDRFSGLMVCHTKSNIRLTFLFSLVETDRTQLKIFARDFEGKDEFAMILQNLEETLSELEKPAETVGAAGHQTHHQFEQPGLSCGQKIAVLERNIASVQQIMEDPEKEKGNQEAWNKLLKVMKTEQKNLEAADQSAEAIAEASESAIQP